MADVGNKDNPSNVLTFSRDRAPQVKRETAQPRQALFGGIAVNENLSGNFLSPHEQEAIGQGFSILRSLFKTDNQDQRSFFATPEVALTVIGVQPSIELSEDQAAFFYKGFGYEEHMQARKQEHVGPHTPLPGINFPLHYSLFQMNDEQHHVLVVNNAAAKAIIWDHAKKLGIFPPNSIDVNDTGQYITYLLNNPTTSHLTQALLQGLPYDEAVNKSEENAKEPPKQFELLDAREYFKNRHHEDTQAPKPVTPKKNVTMHTDGTTFSWDSPVEATSKTTGYVQRIFQASRQRGFFDSMRRAAIKAAS